MHYIKLLDKASNQIREPHRSWQRIRVVFVKATENPLNGFSQENDNPGYSLKILMCHIDNNLKEGRSRRENHQEASAVVHPGRWLNSCKESGDG